MQPPRRYGFLDRGRLKRDARVWLGRVGPRHVARPDGRHADAGAGTTGRDRAGAGTAGARAAARRAHGIDHRTRGDGAVRAPARTPRRGRRIAFRQSQARRGVRAVRPHHRHPRRTHRSEQYRADRAHPGRRGDRHGRPHHHGRRAPHRTCSHAGRDRVAPPGTARGRDVVGPSWHRPHAACGSHRRPLRAGRRGSHRARPRHHRTRDRHFRRDPGRGPADPAAQSSRRPARAPDRLCQRGPQGRGADPVASDPAQCRHRHLAAAGWAARYGDSGARASGGERR